MIIFDDEQSLSDIIQSKVTSSLCVPISLSEEMSDKFIESMNRIQDSGCDKNLGKVLARIAENPHPDLMYGSAILASTVMNKNDDVFTPIETWKARHTAINTPFNQDHKEEDIIGHIIASRVLDEDGDLIPDNIDQVPDYFDIEVDFVIYKSIFEAIAKDITEKAPKGEKFVSMEAFFNNFDYALFDMGSDVKIVARNKETSFLTKYLRAYGGSGYYNGYKVGRVLKDFRFSGMGNVDIPANPDSEYKKIENTTFAYVSNVDLVTQKEENTMSKENVNTATVTVEDLQKTIAELQTKIDQNKTQELTESVAKLTEDNTKLSSDVVTANSKVEIAEQKLAEAKTNFDNLTKDLESAKAELKTKTDALDKIEKAAKANDRYSKLKELGIDLTDERKTKIADMTDEAFASVIEFTQSVSNKTDNTTQASAALDGAEPEKKPDVTSTPGDNEAEAEKIQKVAAKLVDAINAARPKKPNKK